MSSRPGEPTRRGVLASAVLLVAEPTTRFTQAQVRYQPAPRGGLSCKGCTFFRKPDSCVVVLGRINPNGWCQLFDLPD